MWLPLLVAGLYAAEPGYVDPAVCRPCHQQIYDNYLQTGMGRSFSRVSQLPPLARFSHALSKREYAIVPREGVNVLRCQPGPFEKRIDFAIGSGNHSQTFVHRDPTGRLIELPVSWYAEDKSWHMSPGYDRRDHSDFSREISESCLFCHNGYPSRANGGLANGIDCQRCHGPGERHSTNPQEAITNPAKLPHDRQLDVCLQCHLESASRTLPDAIRRFGRGPFSYRPGEQLAGFQVYFEFVNPPSDERMTVNGAGFGLLKSQCFVKSAGHLRCTTCHDPHKSAAPDEAEAHYRAICRSCHASTHETATRNCTGCHMGKRRTEDAVHVVMTEHRIHKQPVPGDSLAPLTERHDRASGPVRLLYPASLPETPENQLYLALANRDIPAVQRALAATQPRHAEPYLMLGEMLRSSSRQQEALKPLRRAIELEPHDSRPYVLTAEIQIAEGEAAAAIRLLEPALTRVTDRVPLLNALAILYTETGRVDDALLLLNQAVTLRPDDAASWLNLGVCREAQGDRVGAADAYRQSLKIQPSSIRAAQFLRRVSTLPVR